MKMRAVVEIWLKSLIDDFTLGGLHSALLNGDVDFLDAADGWNGHFDPFFVVVCKV